MIALAIEYRQVEKNTPPVRLLQPYLVFPLLIRSH